MIFGTKYTLYFSFIVFQIHSRYYGYLIIIIITTHSIATAMARPPTDATLIVCLKNNFEYDIKCDFFENFYYYSPQCLYILMILLIYFVVVYKFLLVYYHIQVYQLYKNMALLLYHNKYNICKIDIKCIIVSKNFSKITQISMYYYCIASKTINNYILWYTRYVCMLIYFFNFLKAHWVCLFICSLVFVKQSTQSVECSIFVLEQ